MAAHMAGRMVEDHHQRVLAAMDMLDGDMGAEEIARYAGLHPYQVRKRLPELKAQGLVELADGTRKTSSGRQERLWRVAGAPKV